MTRRRRTAVVVVAGLVAAGIAQLADPSGKTGALVLLAAGLVLGELFVLRLENGTAVPLSYAVLLVIASSFAVPRYAAAVAGAELISAVAAVLRSIVRVAHPIMLERLVVAAATIAVYDGFRSVTHYRETVGAVLLTLGAAALSQFRWISPLGGSCGCGRRSRPGRASAWLAIASSGILMAIGYRGVDGHGEVGIWGPLLFSTPLLAAWYAFERLDTATRAYRQTIESLAMAPEFGGIVPARSFATGRAHSPRRWPRPRRVDERHVRTSRSPHCCTISDR